MFIWLFGDNCKYLIIIFWMNELVNKFVVYRFFYLMFKWCMIFICYIIYCINYLKDKNNNVILSVFFILLSNRIYLMYSNV